MRSSVESFTLCYNMSMIVAGGALYNLLYTINYVGYNTCLAFYASLCMEEINFDFTLK